MFNLADRPLQRGFSRGRGFDRPGAKARFARARGPGSFCFSWHSRHSRVSYFLLRAETFNSQLEASV